MEKIFVFLKNNMGIYCSNPTYPPFSGGVSLFFGGNTCSFAFRVGKATFFRETTHISCRYDASCEITRCVYSSEKEIAGQNRRLLDVGLT